MKGVYQRYFFPNKRVDETSFDVLTDECAYWVGFLMADGCVSYSGCEEGTFTQPKISLKLKSSDVGHIKKFMAFVKYTGSITNAMNASGFTREKKYASCSMGFRSKVIADRLAHFGVTAKKSHTCKAHDDLIMNRHFWRGVVDGDGTWTITKEGLGFGLIGSKFLVDQFLEFLNRSGIETRQKALLQIKSYVVHFARKKGRQIACLLYQDGDCWLDRKAAIAVTARTFVPKSTSPKRKEAA